MYLTHMSLNPTRQVTKRLVASPQVAHALVEGSFPPGGVGRHLWRLDRSRTELSLYIVSPEPPDLTGIVEQAGWPTLCTWETRDYQPFLDRLQEGQEWRFRLTANPTTSTRDGSGRRGRIRPLRTVSQQEQWLLSRAQRHGFTVPETSLGARDVVITNRDQADFNRRADPDTPADRVTLTRATYQGTLRITAPEALRVALMRGIGRGKGYGCGLLTLAR